MTADHDALYASYEEWYEATTTRCGIKLTADYCAERVAALSNAKDPSTRRFIELFGKDYRDRLIQWFERAGAKG